MIDETESTLIRAHIPCPKCSSHDACAEYTDHYHCFSCNSTWRKDSNAYSGIENNFERRLEKMEEGKIREIADRCLTEETSINPVEKTELDRARNIYIKGTAKMLDDYLKLRGVVTDD